MNRILSFCCVLFFVFVEYSGIAQTNLVLMKTGKVHHFYYQAGDRISYKDQKLNHKVSGKILILNDSIVELTNAPRENISDISCIYRTRHFFAQSAGAGVVVLGFLLPISLINRAIQHEHPLVNDDILIVNGSMIAISGISALFLVRKFPIGNKWHIKVLDFGHPVYD